MPYLSNLFYIPLRMEGGYHLTRSRINCRRQRLSGGVTDVTRQNKHFFSRKTLPKHGIESYSIFKKGYLFPLGKKEKRNREISMIWRKKKKKKKKKTF